MGKDKKKRLIEEILHRVKANGLYIGGDLVFSLAFRTVGELEEIASELHIPVRGVKS